MSDDAIIHIDDIPWTDGGQGEHFAHQRRKLGRAGKALGCSMIELPPGKTAWPFHYHLGNEEALYILEGEATLRLGAARHRVRAGHYVALPADSDHAHQLTNTTSEPCRYLVISTMREPDVTVYPDSDKIGVFAGAAPGANASERTLDMFVPRAAAVDYWHDEPIGARTADSEAAEADAQAQQDELIDDQLAQMRKRLGLNTEP
jgi:uncharacterized cupin superfamily protein